MKNGDHMMTVDNDEERDKRIRTEVIVDAYTPDEQALSWYYYLEDKMMFPFQARCIEERTISPLEDGEEVRVVGMTDGKDCMSEMFVRIEWMNREFGVPLTQLELIDVDSETQEAVADRHYWSGDRGRLC
jgi:hypothetical protein